MVSFHSSEHLWNHVEVIVKEVICIKLLLSCNEDHKSVTVNPSVTLLFLLISIDYDTNKLGLCNSQTLGRSLWWGLGEAERRQWGFLGRLLWPLHPPPDSWFLEKEDLIFSETEEVLIYFLWCLLCPCWLKWVSVCSHWCLRGLLDIVNITLRSSSDLNVNCENPSGDSLGKDSVLSSTCLSGERERDWRGMLSSSWSL